MYQYLINGPINERGLLQCSGTLIEEGLPESPTPSLATRFNILKARHATFEKILTAYAGDERSFLACLMVGRYYANLERALGSYRTAQITTPRA